mgnify:FL=1
MKYLLGLVISLDLSGNRISGSIPNEIGSLTGLYNLNLSSNLLIRSIPSSLGNLLTLESLDVSNNQLNGTIPDELTNLTSLAFLNLSNNKLSGAIPKGMFLLTAASLVLLWLIIIMFQLRTELVPFRTSVFHLFKTVISWKCKSMRVSAYFKMLGYCI